MVAVERTFAMIKPHCFRLSNEIFGVMANSELSVKITQQTVVQFTPQLVSEFYSEHVGKTFYENLSNCMCEGPTLCFVLEGDNAIQKWRNFIGPTNVNVACKTAPRSLRALYADKTNTAMNAVHGSDCVESVEKEISLISQHNNWDYIQIK